MLALLLALLLALAQTPAETREERVLALLQGLARPGNYGRAAFVAVTSPPGAGPVLVPEVVTLCANSDCGTFDDARARRLARELAEIFGLELVTDALLAEGDRSVELDGLDRTGRIAFELRGRGNFETFGAALPEPAEAALDPAEIVWLTSRGTRVHVADVETYRNCDGDEFTPTLAYLAGLTRFLNACTEGEDVELGGLLFEREATWGWPSSAALDPPSGIHAAGGGDVLTLVVERAGKLSIACRGTPDLDLPTPVFFGRAPDSEARRRARSLSGSTRGAPSALVVPAQGYPLSGNGPEPEFVLRLRQQREGAEFVHEARSFTLFAPSAFDLAQPFELEFELAPGRYTFWGPARLGAAAPR